MKLLNDFGSHKVYEADDVSEDLLLGMGLTACKKHWEQGKGFSYAVECFDAYGYGKTFEDAVRDWQRKR